VEIKRFDVFVINLDPTIGSEIKIKRPCVIVSPNEMNKHLNTVIIAPFTSRITLYPTRVNITLRNKKGQVVLDQIRTVDKSRLINKAGKLSEKASKQVSEILVEMFQF
jgi:mRNA interferase MazF